MTNHVKSRSVLTEVVTVLREIEISQVQNGYISGAEGNRRKDRIVAISMIEYRGPNIIRK